MDMIKETIDSLGLLREELKALRATEKDLCAQLLDLSAGEHQGYTFAGLVVEKIDWRLKTKAVQKEMGEAWWLKRCSQSESRSIRTSRIDA